MNLKDYSVALLLVLLLGMIFLYVGMIRVVHESDVKYKAELEQLCTKGDVK